MATKSGRTIKRWLAAFVWCMSQPTGFTRREFDKSNPEFGRGSESLVTYFFEVLIDQGYLVSFKTVWSGSCKRYVYVPKPIYEFCSHGLPKGGDTCPFCKDELKKRMNRLLKGGKVVRDDIASTFEKPRPRERATDSEKPN